MWILSVFFGVAMMIGGGMFFNDPIANKREKAFGLVLALAGFAFAIYGIHLEDPTFFIRYF